MQFASVGGLWFVLSLPLIVVLYLLKRRYADTEVSSHLLWRHVLREQEANRPWQRLRRQLLLWLQLLAAALLVLALMQPFIWRGHGAKQHVVFVLDASASMNAAAGDSTRLEQAKANMIHYADKEASGSIYSLLIMRDQPELLLRKQAGLDGLKSALDKVTPFFGRTAYKETISLASSLTKEDKQAEIRLYTDKQWTESAEGIDFAVPVTIEDVAAQSTVNHSGIIQFGVKADPGSTRIRASASLKNWGTAASSFDVTLFAESRISEVRKITLNGGEQRSVYFENLPDAPYYKLQLELKDGLAEDQSSFAFLQSGGRKLGALVGYGNLFLEKALAVADIDVLKIQRSGDGTYPAPSGKAPDFLILDGVEPAELTDSAWKKLLSGKPLLQFSAASTAATGALRADPPFTIEEHAVSRFLRFQDMHIAVVKKQEAPVWGKPIVTAGQLPILFAGTEQGVPRLLFAFQLQQSDLPLRSEFPVLVRNSVEWLLKQQGGSLGKALPGEKKEISLSPEAQQAYWQPVDPGGKQLSAEINGSSVAKAQTVPQLPGLYKWIETDRSGAIVQSSFLEVAMDARESELNRKIDPEIKPGESEQPYQASNGLELSAFSLIPWMVSLLLIVLLLEWEVYRRGHSV